jgi:hypothetical protein
MNLSLPAARWISNVFSFYYAKQVLYCPANVVI